VAAAIAPERASAFQDREAYESRRGSALGGRRIVSHGHVLASWRAADHACATQAGGPMHHRVLSFTAAGILVACSAHAQLPGQLLAGFPPNPAVTLAEGAEAPIGTLEPTVQVPLQSPVQSGYLVLYEPGAVNLTDPHNWSDVVVFTAASHGPLCQAGDPATQAILVSDAPGEIGITDADLGQAGTTIAHVLGCGAFTVFREEGTRADGLNVYNPDPNSTYNIFSDSAEGATPAGKTSWGQIKMIYR
jgi:hypothetical protein